MLRLTSGVHCFVFWEAFVMKCRSLHLYEDKFCSFMKLNFKGSQLLPCAQKGVICKCLCAQKISLLCFCCTHLKCFRASIHSHRYRPHTVHGCQKCRLITALHLYDARLSSSLVFRIVATRILLRGIYHFNYYTH